MLEQSHTHTYAYMCMHIYMHTYATSKTYDTFTPCTFITLKDAELTVASEYNIVQHYIASMRTLWS